MAGALVVASPGLAVPTPVTSAQSTTFAGYNFAGYIAVPGTVTAVAVVPRLNCKATPAAGSSIYVGVGIESVNSQARLYLACTPKHAARYYPSLLVGGTSRNFVRDLAQPGDRVEFEVSQSVSIVTCSVIDLTRKFVVTANGGGGGTSEGILAGDFPGVPGATSPVPDFGTVAFSSALINGYPFGAAAPNLQTDNLQLSSPGPVQIKTVYSTSNKEIFSTVFKHS